MPAKPNRSAAWTRSLNAVAHVPATLGDVRARTVYVGGRRTSIRFDEPSKTVLNEAATDFGFREIFAQLARPTVLLGAANRIPGNGPPLNFG
jgi:hypothetical protein